MAIVYIGIGSNLGDSKGNIQKAIKMMEQDGILKQMQTSSVYLTEPIGPKKQPDFLNLVVKGKTDLAPFELFDSLLKIEKKLGRKKREKWGPREIDLDILFYDDITVKEKNLNIPHSEIENRKFVLVPLAEISPDLKHPISNKSVKDLLKHTKDQSKVELCEGTYAKK